MALNFPDSPAVGEAYEQWKWDGSKWVMGPPLVTEEESGYTFMSDVMPTTTRSGDTWFDTTDGNSYVWTVDTDSSQWVQTAPGVGSSPVDPLEDEVLDADGVTRYDMRVKLFTSAWGTPDSNGLIAQDASIFGLTTIVGLVCVANYSAVADAPFLQGVRLSNGGGTVTTRWLKSTNGTNYTGGAVGGSSMWIAWGTA